MVIATSSAPQLVLDLALESGPPDLSDLLGAPARVVTRQLRMTFVETADHRLWHAGFVLRHQLDESGQAGNWVLERPWDASWQPLTWPGGRADVPAAASELLLGIVRREPLRPVAELATGRRSSVWQDAAGVGLCQLDDDVVTVEKGARDAGPVRRITMTLPPTVVASRDQVLTRLLDAGATPGPPASMRGILGVEEDSVAPLDGGSTAGDVVRSAIAAGLDRLLDNDWRIRLRSRHPAPENIHQARVATRRLRSDLKTFRPLVDPVWVRHVRSELSWLGDALGRVRDVDVLTARHVVGPDVGNAETPGVEDRLTRLREEATVSLVEAMGSRRYLDLLDRLHAGLRRPAFYGSTAPGEPARRVLPRLVRKRWRKLRRRVDKVSDPPLDTELHRIRIGAKELRYASEVSMPVMGKPATRMASAAEGLQTVLGEHHDAVSAEAWLRDAAASDPSVAFEAGWLAAAERRRQITCARRWRKSWAKVAAKKLRRWIS